MAADPFLHPDCARCADLCCIGLAFDRGDHFAFDKPAGEACRHLTASGCAIHERRAGEGMHGCIAYDCQGAGQRVVQELFDGRHWRDDPALLGPMMSALSRLRRVHALLDLLETAIGLPLNDADRRERDRLAALGRSPAASGQVDRFEREAKAFLASLRRLVERPD